MTLRRDAEPPRRPAPKRPWVIPAIVAVAVIVIAFVAVVVVVSGQSFF